MDEEMEVLFKDNSPDRLGLTHIDRYEVLDQIGIGAMGIVYRVHDSRFACDRALKILRSELVDEEDIVQRFREEGKAAVRAAGEISHPNIVTVYDAGEFDRRPYIVMELFRGVPLDGLVATGRSFTVLEVMHFGNQLAGALASAHNHGVVHRDIKPGNVLISEDGRLAKLTDFSVAQMTAGTNSSLTRTGVVIGAPRYMPPEQALGKVVDGRSDLYGLGIMLHELLTGEKAYQSETFTALLIEISQSKLPSVRSIKKDIPPGVDRVVSKLVEKDPDRRFQSAEELQTAIRREMRGINADAAVRSGGRIPRELLSAGLLSILTGALLVVSGYLLRNQQIQALQEQVASVGLAYSGALANQFSLDYARVGESAGLLYDAQFDNLSEDANFDFQKIVLDSGRVLASTHEDTATVYSPNAILERISLGDEAAETAIVMRSDRSKSLQVSQPIEVGPLNNRRSVGTLYVGLPLDRINAIGRLTTTFMLLLAGTIAGLIGLVSYYLVRRYARPLESLRDGLLLVADGDDDVRMPASREGLIGETFLAFNAAMNGLIAVPSSDEALIESLEQDIQNMDHPTLETQLPAGLADLDVSDETMVVSLEETAPIIDPDTVLVDDRTMVFRIEDLD